MSDIHDVQYFAAGLVRDWKGEPGLKRQFGRPIALWFLAKETGVQEHEAVAALELMAKDGHVEIWRCFQDRYTRYAPGRYGIHDFVCPDFRMLLTPEGMRWYDTETRKRSKAVGIDIGDQAGNEAIRRTMIEALGGRDTPQERRDAVERVLARLVWIAVQNYCDSEFLTKRAFEALPAGKKQGGRRDLETKFYLPFIHAELKRDSQLAPHIIKTPAQAGGVCDLLVVGEFPIEVKVLYPDDTSPSADDLGLAQTTQYAARSGLGFVSVLDMRPRTASKDLGQVANDAQVVNMPQRDGPHSVRIIKVRHVVGHGPPSRARPS